MRARDKPIRRAGGLFLGCSKQYAEQFYCLDEIIHSIVLGATRSGKSRRILLPSIDLQALAGESMVISDPKGELYYYSAPFLKAMGYEVIVLDFVSPLKGNQHNFLQAIIQAVNDGDMPKAIDLTWDITTSLVGEPMRERIWTDGQASVIAASIMAVVYDNRDRPELQNMTNVYHFIAEMCSPIDAKGNTLLPIYIDGLPDRHPSRAIMAIANISPDKMRGSFFSGALVTLRLFTSDYIADMTSRSDFDPALTGDKKRAIFMILPDEKKAYHPLASLFVAQLYEMLVSAARKNGGILNRRVNFNLDEVGNFTAIPDFDAKLTAAGSRNIRFNLFLQSFDQLNVRYGKDQANIIKQNCDAWIYLRCTDPDTLQEISKKLHDYTTTGGSQSASYQTNRVTDTNVSSSQQLMGRALLNTAEIERISMPYSLVMSRTHPALFYTPDLSELPFNQVFGLGDQDYNQQLIMRREAQRTERKYQEVPLWGIWKNKRLLIERVLEKQRQDKLAAFMGANTENPKNEEDIQNDGVSSSPKTANAKSGKENDWEGSQYA